MKTSAGTKRALVGFEAFRTEDNLDFTSPVFQGHEAFVLPFRALLTKQDSITRTKALGELEQTYSTIQDVQAVRDTLPHFAYLYTRVLQRDNDRRIRAGTGKIIKLLAQLVPKAMVNRFDTFGPDWLLACFDLDRESATLALQALKEIDSPELYSRQVSLQLFKFSRQRNPDERLVGLKNELESEEDQLERSCRVRTQALRAMGFLLQKNKLDLEEGDQSQWYKFLVASEEEGGVGARVAAYELLQLVANKQPQVITPPVWKLAFRIVGEKEFKAMPVAFATTCRLASLAEFWRGNVDLLRKAFFPELFRLVGRMPASVPSLLPLLEHIPVEVYDSFPNGKRGFLFELCGPLIESNNPKLLLECLDFYNSTEGDMEYFWQAVDLWLKSPSEIGFESLHRLLVRKQVSKHELEQRAQAVLASSSSKEGLLKKVCRCGPGLFAYFTNMLLAELNAHQSSALLLATKPLGQEWMSCEQLRELVERCRSVEFAAALCELHNCFDDLLPRFKLEEFLTQTKHLTVRSERLSGMLAEYVGDEALVCGHLGEQDALERVAKFTAMGKQALVNEFAFSSQAYGGLKCYPGLIQDGETDLVFTVLAYVLQGIALPTLQSTQQIRLTQWLSVAAAPAAAKHGNRRWWSALCAASSSAPFSPPINNALELVLNYLESGLYSVDLLRAKLQVESMEQLFYQVFVEQRGRVNESQRALRRTLQQDTADSDWFVGFLALCKQSQQREPDFAESLAHVLNEFVPNVWLQDITTMCLAEEDDAVLSVLLERRCGEMAVSFGNEQIAAKLATRLFAAVDLCGLEPTPSTTPNVASTSPTASVSAQLNVGDVVLYTPNNSQGQVSCTVVSKHAELDKDDYYYTVRYWSVAENYSKEVQTTSDRLTLGDTKELEDQAKYQQLVQIQQKLQQARSIGDRQETIRLMKLASELEIKPKDSEQAKLEAVQKRKEREAEFLIQKRRGGGNVDGAAEYADQELMEFTPPMGRGLEALQFMQWRLESQQFGLSPIELEAVRAVVSQILPRLRIQTSHQVSLMCSVLGLAKLEEVGDESAIIPSDALLLRLAQAACEYRNPSFTQQVYHPKLWRESINNRLLAAYVDVAATGNAFAMAIEPLLAKLRLSPTLVLELFPKLFAELLRNKSLGVFAVLFKFSNSPAAEPLLPNSVIAQRFQLQDQDAYTMLLIWLLVLCRIQLVKSNNPGHTQKLEEIYNWLKTKDLLFHVLDQISSSLCLEGIEEQVEVDWFSMTHEQLSSHAFFLTTRTLPTLVREWWCDHVVGRLDRDLVMKYVAQSITPGLIRGDLQELQQSANMFDPTEFRLKLSMLSKTVTLVSLKDDCVLEMQISFPEAYPLFPAQVECVKNIGVRPEKWKRWALQIVQLLNKRTGSLLDAIQIWKKNLDKEFEGIEPCPICYSVLHANDSSLPRLTCKTCKNTFHGLCLSTWFTTSHQSLCPLCKQSFLG
ncbi:hypothetical protein BASA81_001189 [Batrachochytrium salamandrivorans]|nr:hypothetical protein BASA81_001189 [Batrachochytrium salamandrivorans]